MNKFKLLVLSGVLFCATQAAMAQDSIYVRNEYAKAIALFNRAQRYNDGELAKQALMEMSILSPGDTAVLRSLAEIYFGNSQFISSAMVSLDMLSLYPNDLFAREIAAISYENLRLYDKAIEQYESMWLATDNTSILYQISYLQYLQNRFEEAKANLAILEGKSKPEDTITLSKQDGNSQDVAFAAGIANLRGLIAQDQGDKEAARGFFTKALEISPDFEAPKVSLAELNKGN